MVQYYPPNDKKILKHETVIESEESEDEELDPGSEVIEKNRKDRQQRIADHTKDELDKVLKRVEHVKLKTSRKFCLFIFSN